jgi:hypothetical protein
MEATTQPSARHKNNLLDKNASMIVVDTRKTAVKGVADFGQNQQQFVSKSCYTTALHMQLNYEGRAMSVQGF